MKVCLGRGQSRILIDSAAPKSDRYTCVYIRTATHRALCRYALIDLSTGITSVPSCPCQKIPVHEKSMSVEPFGISSFHHAALKWHIIIQCISTCNNYTAAKYKYIDIYIYTFTVNVDILIE